MALKMRWAPALGLLAAATLAACGSGGRSGFDELRTSLAQLARSTTGSTESGGQITATNAQLRAFPQPLILVGIPKLSTSAGLVRQGSVGGAVTWLTPDGVAVTLRRGQVISTAGLGHDLSSADVPDIRRVRGRAVRDLYHLDGDEVTRRTRYSCEISDAGSENVSVTDVSYPTRVIAESCTSPVAPSIENRYWVQSSGLIRKSRQWVGPENGYLVIENVHGR